MDSPRELHRSVRDVLVNLGASLAAAIIVGLVGLGSGGSSASTAIVIMVVAFIVVLGVLSLISRLLERTPASPLNTKRGRQILQRYLVAQRQEVFAALVSGFTGLHVKDVVAADGLFISPPWARYSGQPENDDIVRTLASATAQSGRVLVLGEAGQGKTIVLKRLLATLTDRCMRDTRLRSSPIPIYVPLRELVFNQVDGRRLLWEYLAKHDFPFSF